MAFLTLDTEELKTKIVLVEMLPRWAYHTDELTEIKETPGFLFWSAEGYYIKSY